MKKIVLVMLVLAMVSCKDEKSSTDKIPEVNLPVGNEFFRVTLDVVAEKDDSFHVYYIEDSSQNFTEENSVWTEFKGSASAQKLNFDFPANVVPTQLRVDFGVNKDQGAVKINGIEMTYFDKTATIAGDQISTFFRPNEENTELDAQTHQIKVKDSKRNPYYAPSLYSLEPLAAKMQTITK